MDTILEGASGSGIGGRGAKAHRESWLARELGAERSRWVLWVPVLVGAGIGAYFALPVEPSPAVVGALLLASLAPRLVFRRGTLTTAATGIVVCLALGFAAAKARTEIVRAPIIEAETRAVLLDGWLEQREPRPDKGERLTIRVAGIEGWPAEALPYKVRIRSMLPSVVTEPGAPIRLKTVLMPLPGPAAPGAHDFGRAAWFERIGASGFAVAAPETVGIAAPQPMISRFIVAIARLRADVSARIRAALPGPAGALADALVTGERGNLEAPLLDSLRDSGLAHILAISGSNMAIMAGAVFGLVRGLMALVPVLVLRLPAKKWAAAVGLAGAAFCLVLSGASSATARAFVMIALMLLAVMLDRPALSMRNLALAGLLLLVLEPETLLDVGFQMSFAAVVAIMAVYETMTVTEPLDPESPLRSAGWPRLGRAGRFVLGILLTTMVASLAVAPFSAYHFHKLAQYGLAANLLVVPLFAFVIMPLVVATLIAMPLGLEAWPLAAMAPALEAMTTVSDAVARLPHAVARVPAMPVAAVAAMTLGGLWICLWRRRWRLLGLAGLALGLALAATGQTPDVLISEGGRAFAIRLEDGRLSALPVRGRGFDVAEWLEADADARAPKEAAKGEGFRCDESGCTARVGGLVLAVSSSPASLAEDCRRADILVLRYPRVRACPRPRLLLDRLDLATGGTHALIVSGGAITIATASEAVGRRPWSQAGHAEAIPNGARTAASDIVGRVRSSTSASMLTSSPPPSSAPPGPAPSTNAGPDPGEDTTAPTGVQ